MHARFREEGLKERVLFGGQRGRWENSTKMEGGKVWSRFHVVLVKDQ
jgi:hypothetical protein